MASDTNHPKRNSLDWILRASFGVLVLLSVYTVLGDDLAQVFGVFGAQGGSSQPSGQSNGQLNGANGK